MEHEQAAEEAGVAAARAPVSSVLQAARAARATKAANANANATDTAPRSERLPISGKHLTRDPVIDVTVEMLRAWVLCAWSGVAACGGAEERPVEPGEPLKLAFTEGPEARGLRASGSGLREDETATTPPLRDDDVKPEAPGPAAEARGPKPETSIRGGSPRVDLDVHDADVAEVCRLLADVGRVNVVVGDGVSGRVTVRLRRVPWDVALGAILASKGLTMRREGDVILVTAR